MVEPLSYSSNLHKIMSFQSNPQDSGQKPWWSRPKRDHIGETIAKINNVNDPTTYADEVLKGSRMLLFLLLCFSGILGGMSYLKNFSISFPIEVAVFLAAVITVAIEWGKNRAATWATRIPFFQGLQSTWATPYNTVIFGGLVLVSIATFWMSVYNSTKGGEQLAMMLSHEKSVAFAPDTKAIDDQIAATQKAVSEAPMVKWKGKMYYQSEKSVRSDKRSLETLQQQRADAIKMQRADYESNKAVQAGQTSFAAKLVLASGGWIEFLQVILILLRVACERALAGKQSPTPARANVEPSAPSTGQRIGFNLTSEGNVRNVEQDRGSVPQTEDAVPQINASVFLSPDEALRWFESELKKEPSNFANKHANADTVRARIEQKLSRAHRYLHFTPDGGIPTDSATRFERYLAQDLFPALEQRGYQVSPEILELIKRKSA